MQCIDEFGLRFDGRCLLDIECKDTSNESVYPCLVKKRNGSGDLVFDVSVSGDSNDYKGYDLPGLLRLFKEGAFNRGAQIRMKRLNGRDRSGGAPEKGNISERFRFLVANLDAPKPLTATSGKSDDAHRKEFALDDLAVSGDDEAGDRALRVRNVYLRNPKVRKRVIEYANGLCEYCRRPGFLKLSGERYLEAHHIISLADNGDDSFDNVIGLCPEHHREAHFGANGEALEEKFLKVIAGRRNKC
ncbi:hypothetical protein CR51_36000 [Caballeronia megalochromosomata]|nr:hypothetical protein CR51_36000 [Caballeronia megalochromosomata]